MEGFYKNEIVILKYKLNSCEQNMFSIVQVEYPIFVPIIK